MAALALEYIVRMVILVVAAVIIIGLILGFRNDITVWWDGFIGKNEPEPPKLEPIKGDFTNNDIANFIEGCWASNKERPEDVDCYFLMGDFSITKSGILSEIDKKIIDTDKIIFDFSGSVNALVISYDNYYSETGSEAIVVKG